MTRLGFGFFNVGRHRIVYKFIRKKLTSNITSVEEHVTNLHPTREKVLKLKLKINMWALNHGLQLPLRYYIPL